MGWLLVGFATGAQARSSSELRPGQDRRCQTVGFGTRPEAVENATGGAYWTACDHECHSEGSYHSPQGRWTYPEVDGRQGSETETVGKVGTGSTCQLREAEEAVPARPGEDRRGIGTSRGHRHECRSQGERCHSTWPGGSGNGRGDHRDRSQRVGVSDERGHVVGASWFLPGGLLGCTAIAAQIGSTVSQLCFQRGPSALSDGDYTYRGRRVDGIIAVAPRATGPEESSFTFVDARRVGRGIRAFLRQVWTDASSILRCIDPKVPEGFSASLHTRAWAGEAPDDIQWDWQEVCFRVVSNGPQIAPPESSGDASGGLEDIVESNQPSTAHDDVAISDGLGFYAAIATGPLEPAHLPVEVVEGSEPRDKIWFLLFAPDRTPETVLVSLSAPLCWDEALAAVCSAREEPHRRLYGHVCKVHPQPSAEFACLICLPSWARHRTAVVLDSRSFDGRLYCLLLDPWMQWSSFLLHANLPDAEDMVVIIQGIAHARGRPITAKQGDMIQVIGYGAAIPPVLALDDLLFAGEYWEPEPPLAFSSSFSHFWVLHEGGSTGIDADYHKINSAYGFQEFAADALQFAQYRTTLKTASPRIQDAVFKGVLCKAVVLVTECLPTLPVPPARVVTPLTVVFLDMRSVLRGLDWRILVQGEVDIEVFKQGLKLDVPSGFVLKVDGGNRVTRHGVIFLQAEDRTVLTISYVRRTAHPSTDKPEEDGDSDSSDSDSDSSNDSGPDSPTGDKNPAARSRSPRNHKTRNRGSKGSKAPASSTHAASLAIVRSCPVSSLGEDGTGLDIDGAFHRNAVVEFSCGFSGPEGVHITGPRCPGILSCKILVEPHGGHRDTSGAEAISYLRYAAPRLGFPWRYMTPAGAFHIEDGDSSESDSDAPHDPPLRVCFRVLVPGFAAEKVEISLTFPTTVAEVLPLVQVARCQRQARNFPRLVPASPQPLVGEGVFLACPAWSVAVATARSQVCVDCSTVDGRIYSAVAPPYLTAASVLELVKLPRAAQYSVFAGSYGDLLQGDSHCHVAEGDTIIVLPEDSADPRIVPMHVALLGRQHWGRQPRVPEPSCHGTCCVVFGEENILHINSQGHGGAFRAQIANSVGIRSSALRVISTRPRVWNAAIDGLPCRSVVIVNEAITQAQVMLPWILVDARGLFLGWRAQPAPGGQFSCRDCLDGILQELGSGWRLWFRDVPLQADILEVRTGQVFVVEIIYERPVSRLGNLANALPSDAVESSAGADPPVSGAPDAPADTAGVVTGQAGYRANDYGPSQPSRISADAHDITNDSSPPEQGGLGVEDDFADISFLLLKQNYVHEWVSVRLPTGTAVSDALNAAASARHPADSVRMPVLCAVHPQPRADVAMTVCPARLETPRCYHRSRQQCHK